MARRPGPERTCVGCRFKAAKATLLRVVAVGGVLVPDATGVLPGRGAHVHRDPRCVALADKRRAFPRALRLAGPLDVTPVREHLQETDPHQTDPHQTDPHQTDPHQTVHDSTRLPPVRVVRTRPTKAGHLEQHSMSQPT